MNSNLYIPLGGNKINKFRQVCSLFVSFAFISYWHGYNFNVVLWSIGNFVMVVIELLYFNVIIKRDFLNKFVCFNSLNQLHY
jgi:D-alanyl-lipoteichoic acid acyltransferase DltB (MBOAT superfamily)